MGSGERDWKLNLNERFELFDGAGRPVVMPYRKVEQLFLLLARTAERTVDREIAARTLWPDASARARATNLRQALSKLRTSLGPDFIQSDRSTLWLSSEFPRVTIGGPAMSHADSHARPLCALEPPASAFGQVLEWLAESDPSQALELMRTSVDLASSLSCGSLVKVTDAYRNKGHSNASLSAWVTYWEGLSSLPHEQLSASRSLFRRAAIDGENLGEDGLLTEAIYYLAACEILLGRTSAAVEAVTWARDRAESKSDRRSVHKLSSILGTAQLHQGKFRLALETLEATPPDPAAPLAYADKEALRSLYLASVGFVAQAREALLYPASIAYSSGHVGLIEKCDLAQGIIQTEEDPATAIPLLDALANECSCRHQRHIELYAHETLAVAHFKLGAKSAARSAITQAKALRSQLSMRVSAWDRRRLSPLLVA